MAEMSLSHYCSRETWNYQRKEVVKGRSMFVFGLGYTGVELGKQLRIEGWKVSGTCRSVEKTAVLKDKYGLDAHVFCSDSSLKDDGLEALYRATHLLCCVPPDVVVSGTDSVLHHHMQDIKTSALSRTLRWIGYLSSTGVYGNHQGGWVDESSELKPVDRKSTARLQAEMAWLQLLQQGQGVSIQIFRAGGIYGPGRSILDGLLSASKRPVPDARAARRFTSRVHVTDLCQVIQASIRAPNPGRIYNVVDDDPASRAEVEEFARRLVKVRHPEVVKLVERQETFQGAEKRVINRRIKEELGVKLIYPSYKEGLVASLEGTERRS